MPWNVVKPILFQFRPQATPRLETLAQRAHKRIHHMEPTRPMISIELVGNNVELIRVNLFGLGHIVVTQKLALRILNLPQAAELPSPFSSCKPRAKHAPRFFCTPYLARHCPKDILHRVSLFSADRKSTRLN